MKKLLCLVLIGGAFVAFTSCSSTKTCDCIEKNLGLEIKDIAIKSGEYKAYSNCKQLQNALNKEGEGFLNYSCK